MAETKNDLRLPEVGATVASPALTMPFPGSTRQVLSNVDDPRVVLLSGRPAVYDIADRVLRLVHARMAGPFQAAIRTPDRPFGDASHRT